MKNLDIKEITDSLKELNGKIVKCEERLSKLYSDYKVAEHDFKVSEYEIKELLIIRNNLLNSLSLKRKELKEKNYNKEVIKYEIEGKNNIISVNDKNYNESLNKNISSKIKISDLGGEIKKETKNNRRLRNNVYDILVDFKDSISPELDDEKVSFIGSKIRKIFTIEDLKKECDNIFASQNTVENNNKSGGVKK